MIDEFDMQVTSAKGLIILSIGDINRMMPVVDWYQKLDSHFCKMLPRKLDKILAKLATSVRSTLT